MEFKEFAEILKPIISGSYSTHVFTKTLFESIITEDGLLQIEDVSKNTFKAYYNGQTKITKIAQRIMPHIDPEQFISYLDNFSDATTQSLCDAFSPHIKDIDLHNASQRIAYLFEDILKTSAAKKRKSTPKSAKNKDEKTPHDVLTEKVLASGQVIADVWGKAISNLVVATTATDKIDENNLNPKDLAFFERFRNQVDPLLTYCMDHDPTGEGTKLSLADEINDFLQSWKYDVRKIQDNCFRKIVIDAMQVLGDYKYYLSDKFLRLIPDTNILWFRNESIEEGNQLRDILRPETLKKRTEMRDIYVRLYPILEEDANTHPIEIPEVQPSTELSFTSEDNQLLQEFTSDYDEIMLTLISDNFSTSLIDMTLPCKIKDLFDNKWSVKANGFIDLSLKSNVFALLGELNTLNNSLTSGSSTAASLKRSRTKIRNLYVKLHPVSFDGNYPFDAFIDDWNDGEY